MTTRYDTSHIWFDIDKVDIGYHYSVDLEGKTITDITVTNLYFDPRDNEKVTISITFSPGQTWSAWVYNYDETQMLKQLADQSTDNPVYVEWDGKDQYGQEQESGTYVIVISVSGMEQDLKFYVHLDKTNPSISILWPESGSTVIGF